MIDDTPRPFNEAADECRGDLGQILASAFDGVAQLTTRPLRMKCWGACPVCSEAKFMCGCELEDAA